ncbi:MAG: AI-2E family transporter [Bacteroidetes bacterium]|nr:AI-2E family transporter [Bacteroidota bacterium]
MKISTVDDEIRGKVLILLSVLLSVLVLDRIVSFLFTGKDLLIPFVVALFLSMLFSPIAEFFERKKFPSFVAVLLSIIITLSILFAVFQILYTSITAFVDEWSMHRQDFAELETAIRKSLGSAGHPLEGDTWIENPKVAGWLRTLASEAQTFFSELALSLLFLLFLMTGRNKLIKKMRIAFPEKFSDQANQAIRNIQKDVLTYLKLKTIIGLSVGLTTTIALMLFGIKSAVIWGILGFLFYYIPNIGSIVSVSLPVLFAYVQTNSDSTATWVLIVLIVIHMLIGNILEPKIMSKGVDLSPVVILFALIFWSFVWGIPGMFLSVPIMVIIKIVLEQIETLRPLGILMGDKEER